MNRAAACMTGRYRRVAVACMLVVAAAASVATAGVRQATGARPKSGSWLARSSTGQTLMGTWKAEFNTATGAVAGSWTLDSPAGKVLAHGVWSATKAPAGWSGRWRAAADGRKSEYEGTWAAEVKLAATASFADLFAQAIKGAVGGAWRTGRQSGQWSIRAAN